MIVLVILTLVGLLINSNTQENRIELTDLGGDCEENGGVCYPNDPDGECDGSVACYTLTTEEECVGGGGQWTSLGQAKAKLKIQANKRVRLEIQTDDPASLAILANTTFFCAFYCNISNVVHFMYEVANQSMNSPY